MVHNTIGLHHLNTRKRIHEKHEPYPHPDKLKRFFDKFIFLVGIIGPLFAMPQLIEIWIKQNAAGVSIFSWTAFTIVSSFWVVYGWLHKEKPIIISYGLWVIVDLLIVIGTVIYG